jgi:hypothetical protein
MNAVLGAVGAHRFYIVTAVGNCGFMLPSSAGGPAVAAGYGVNLKTMFV